LRLVDDFVKLAAIQPDSSALGAIVDFNPLSLCKPKLDITYRTHHAGHPFLAMVELLIVLHFQSYMKTKKIRIAFPKIYLGSGKKKAKPSA
jgi:hypothetical protein